MRIKPGLSRKQAIERKATELFRDKGYAATSMRDLAQNLGVEAASLYSHIPSKEALLQQICFRTAQAFFDGLDQADREADLSPTQRLQRYIAAHVQVVTDNLSSSAVFSHEWRHLSEPHLSEFLQLRQAYEEKFRTVLRTGIAAGEFAPTDVKFAAVTVLSALNWMHLWYKPDGGLTPSQLAQQLSSMLLQGIGQRTVQTT